MRAHAPPQLGVLVDRARLVEEADVRLVLVPAGEGVRHAAAREEAREDLRPHRVEPRVDALGERRARRDGEQLGQEAAQAVDDRDRAIGAPDADVDVEAERVVLPDDVLEDLVVAPVVRRVDDPLVLPARPRDAPRSRRAPSPSGSTSAASCRAALGEHAGHVGERLDAPGLDLDLGGDQLAGEVALGLGAARGVDDVLVAVDEIERVPVEERELLLDGDGEVVRRLEPLSRLAQELLVRHSLCVAHGAEG